MINIFDENKKLYSVYNINNIDMDKLMAHNFDWYQ